MARIQVAVTVFRGEKILERLRRLCRHVSLLSSTDVKYLAPAGSRTGEPQRSVSTPPGANLPGEKQLNTEATNAGSACERERSTARPLTAARGDADGKKYKEESSAGIGAATIQARERTIAEDKQRHGGPATYRARWGPGDEDPNDGGGSRTDWREPVLQRQAQHEQGQALAEEQNGYRAAPAGDEYEQQQATTGGVGVTVIPTTAADSTIRQDDQPPVDITTARANDLLCDIRSNTRFAQVAANKGVPSATINANRAGKSNTVVHDGRYHGGNPFDMSAATVRVQRVFRGHEGRGCAGAEERKRASQRASERDARIEREWPHAASRRLSGRLPRPKLPSTYGF